MVVMFKMTGSKKEKMLHKLEKMEEFIDEFKECLEEAEEVDYDFREDYDHDYDEHDLKKMMRRYKALKRAGKM